MAKYKTTLFLVLFIIFILGAGMAQAHSGGQAYAVKTDQKIVIDGDLSDPAWGKAIPIYVCEDLVPAWQKYMTHVSLGTLPASSADLSYIAYLLWDDQFLYIGIKVNDDKLVFDKKDPYQNDALELFFDPGHKAKTVNQIFLGLKKADTDKPYITLPGAKIAGMVNDMLPPYGYTLETAIPWKAVTGMDNPKPGTVIGFDIQADDADEPGKGRKCALVWSGGENRDWTDASVYGDLQFISGN